LTSSINYRGYFKIEDTYHFFRLLRSEGRSHKNAHSGRNSGTLSGNISYKNIYYKEAHQKLLKAREKRVLRKHDRGVQFDKKCIVCMYGKSEWNFLQLIYMNKTFL
jgi:hypothetical protein